MRIISIIAISLLIISMTTAITQESSYQGFEGRKIKSLSQEQVDDYLEGSGMGMALPAELNNYPGPKHVLELGDSLKITPEQKKEIQSIFNKMHDEAVRLGNIIVEKERELDQLFASGKITDESLESLINEISILKSKLRFAHLNAHLKTCVILSPSQIAAYNQHRGYGQKSMHHRYEHGEHGGKE